MTSDIDVQALIAYETGVAPADYAEAEITSLINAHFVAALRAVAEPGPHPDYSTPAMARRILGALLNIGWEMPVWPVPEPEAREAS
jgi:hypothetical protein